MSKDTKSYKKLRWVTLFTARRLVNNNIFDDFVDAWQMDLFSVCRVLGDLFPDTLFFLVDRDAEERMEVL